MCNCPETATRSFNFFFDTRMRIATSRIKRFTVSSLVPSSRGRCTAIVLRLGTRLIDQQSSSGRGTVSGQTASSASPDMAEQQAFREVYAELMEAIQDPVYLAANLYSAGIIPVSVRTEMTTPGVSRFEKNDKLLTAVESQIKATPQKFARFLSVLSRDPSMEPLVEKLQNTYSEAQNLEKNQKQRRIDRKFGISNTVE